MTAEAEAVAKEIRRIAREELRLEIPADDKQTLAASLDSLSLLSLVVAVEDRYRVVLAEEDAANTRSLADLAQLVAGRVSSEASP